jgi:hypothetical protein
MATKDATKVAAGLAGAAARWGIAKHVRLDGFDADERVAILAAIDAKRAAKTARIEKADTVPEEIETDQEGRRDRGERHNSSPEAA